MTVDRDTTAESERHVVPGPAGQPSAGTRNPDGKGNADTATVSTVTVVAYAVAGAAILGWFLFGWLVLQQGFIDSVGESAGTAFALLLVVSIVGTVRRGRRR